MLVDVRVPLAVITLGPAKVYFHYCHSYCLLKVYFQTPSTRSRVLWRTETFFLRIRLPSTLNRRFRAPKTKGFQIRSSGWTVLKTEIHRIRMDRRKRRFSNTTDDVMPRFQNRRTCATFPGIISSVVAIIKGGNREICCCLRIFILFSKANLRMRLLRLFRCPLKEESRRKLQFRITLQFPQTIT